MPHMKASITCTIIFFAFFTEHGTIFTGTKHPYYGNPMIQSRSLRPGSEEIFTSGTDQSDFYTGLYNNFDSFQCKIVNDLE